jgi:hypothetical protein
MKALFEILPAAIDSEKCTLICEAGEECFAYAIKNEEQNMFVGVAVYEFEKGTDFKTRSGLIHDLLWTHTPMQGNFRKVHIVYSFSESVFIPFTLYSSLENENVLNLVHGDMNYNTAVFADLVTESGVYNAYRIPAPVHHVLNQKFPGAENMHQYSVLLKLPQPAEDKLFIIFYPNRVVVKLNKGSRTEIINSFCYKTAQDVVYILLNTCKQFDLENVPVEVAGFIDKDSALFKEIYKYFGIVHLSSLPIERNYSETISEHPSHFFSHIFAVDSCG